MGGGKRGKGKARSLCLSLPSTEVSAWLSHDPTLTRGLSGKWGQVCAERSKQCGLRLPLRVPQLFVVPVLTGYVGEWTGWYVLRPWFLFHFCLQNELEVKSWCRPPFFLASSRPAGPKLASAMGFWASTSQKAGGLKVALKQDCGIKADTKQEALPHPLMQISASAMQGRLSHGEGGTWRPGETCPSSVQAEGLCTSTWGPCCHIFIFLNRSQKSDFYLKTQN